MLHINDLTYRIGGRLILDAATVGIPAGHKVGMVGRNGTGKTTLFRLLLGEIAADSGSFGVAKNMSIGAVAQEAPGGPETLLAVVLAAHGELAALTAEAETATDPQRIADIQTRLADIGAHAAPARAAVILAGLGFSEAAMNGPCSALSGGWRMRVALAAALFASPDILLLDEPTNYLDLEGTLWLQAAIPAYPGTVIVISHDRDLLNSSVAHILHLTDGKLTLYTGGYDTFEETRRERQRLQLKLKKKQDDAMRHMEAFVERFRAKASKAAQAQSRLKALAKMQPIAADIEGQVVPFRFPSPTGKMGNPLIRFDNAVAGYPGRPSVLRGVNLRIDADDRIALLGANGNGKSTLAKLICGRLEVTGGQRAASKKLTFGYFAQHQLDELTPKHSPYQHIAELLPDATEAQKRARVAAIGFGADKSDTAVEKLSGGEKARLALALATFHAPHLFILDEPTNHLDIDSREALIHALNAYEGAVILISHDRHLIEATADRLWIVRDGAAQPYDGDLDSYRAECLAEGREARRARNGDARGDARRAAATRREDIAPLRKAVRDAETEMGRIRALIGVLDKRLGDASLHVDQPKKARALTTERQLSAKRLTEVEERWLAASAALEFAQNRDAAA